MIVHVYRGSQFIKRVMEGKICQIIYSIILRKHWNNVQNKVFAGVFTFLKFYMYYLFL